MLKKYHSDGLNFTHVEDTGFLVSTLSPFFLLINCCYQNLKTAPASSWNEAQMCYIFHSQAYSYKLNDKGRQAAERTQTNNQRRAANSPPVKTQTCSLTGQKPWKFDCLL